ncbi:TetR/AcrR family transcriptional regulator [Sporohalobacter salinus]|uniref:TetR/AcrR family transcriptional regulator n=1 Tax=Sporohalobacter salinus TaxID=1494606 RepID=UPI00196214AF|nr:TetR/AcrR family transcriptional regulator [Sporohalobacter salinus]MBM7624107.1 AcrR family transcriptional regulator [Sporohalobacter salinus]
MAPKLVNVDQKKQKIIEGTLAALAKKELNQLKIADIADELDMGQSTIYEYFKNKDELIKEALEYFLQQLHVPEENESLTALEELKRLLKQVEKQVKANKLNEINLLIDLFYQGIKGDFNQLEEVYKDYLDYMEARIAEDQKRGLIREDINPQALASWVGAVVDGLGLQILLRSEGFDIDEVLGSFIEAVEIYTIKES